MASEQRESLWQRIEGDRYEKLPPYPSPLRRPLATAQTLIRMGLDARFAAEVIDAPYLDQRDVRPPRDKLFHAVGLCAACDFVVDDSQRLTGVFASGALGIVRLSLATDEMFFSPGVALKLLRDDAPSANVLAGPGLDPQWNKDFFAHTATTEVSPPETPAARAFVALLGNRRDPYRIGLGDVAAFDRCGVRVARPRAPRVLAFRPARRLGVGPGGDWRQRALSALRPGDTLYHVDADGLALGRVVLTSAFVASRFGDCELAFAHRD